MGLDLSYFVVEGLEIMWLVGVFFMSVFYDLEGFFDVFLELVVFCD